MAQSTRQPFTNQPANRLLDGLPDEWLVEQTTECRMRDVTYRKIVARHRSGATLRLTGNSYAGYSVSYRAPDSETFDTVASTLRGHRQLAGFEQGVDRVVHLAARLGETLDA